MRNLIALGFGLHSQLYSRDIAFAVILLAGAAWTIWRPVKLTEDGASPIPTGKRKLAFIAAFFLIGVYGGFIQAGIGFLLLAATSAAGFNLIRGNALKVTVVLTFTPLALVLFAWGGKVEWAVGFALAAGNFLGGLAGVRLQILKGHAWVRSVARPVVPARTAMSGLNLTAPRIIKNSPMNPEVPGSPTEASMATAKKRANTGALEAKPPKSSIFLVSLRSSIMPSKRKSTPVLVAWATIWKSVPVSAWIFMQKIPRAMMPICEAEENASILLKSFWARAAIPQYIMPITPEKARIRA